jgi:hypothetical protein
MHLQNLINKTFKLIYLNLIQKNIFKIQDILKQVEIRLIILSKKLHKNFKFNIKKHFWTKKAYKKELFLKRIFLICIKIYKI